MALLGTLDAAGFIEAPETHLDWDELLSGADVVLTKPGSPEFHQPVALFTAKGARRLLEEAGCEVVTIAAANPLTHQGQTLAQIEASPQAEERLTELELALCEEPGLVDAGESSFEGDATAQSAGGFRSRFQIRGDSRCRPCS